MRPTDALAVICLGETPPLLIVISHSQALTQ